MDISISIKMTDEFDQKFEGVSSSIGLDNDAHDNQLSVICDHVKRAISALGFSEKQIQEYLKEF